MKRLTGLGLVCLISLCFAFSAIGAEEGLIAHWDFNEGDGLILHDKSGNKNNAHIYGAEWVKGIEGCGLKFDGEDDYVIAFPAETSLDMGTDDFTAGVWFYREGNLSQNVCLSKLGYNAKNCVYWGYNFFGGLSVWGDENSGTNHMRLEKDIPEKEWVFMAATINRANNSLRYYENGVPSPQNPIDISAVDGSIDTLFDFSIGHFSYAGVEYYTKGIVDEVKIYKRALTAEEIKAHYDKGAKSETYAMVEEKSPLDALYPAGWNWKAHTMSPSSISPPRESDDYAAITYNDAWDFDEGDTEGIAGFDDGLKDVKVIDGKLTFTTGEGEKRFFWGDLKNRWDLEIPDERIGIGWRQGSEWKTVIRLKQSLPESKWTFYVRGCRGGGRKKTTLVKGTKWQTIHVPIYSVRNPIHHHNAFSVTSDKPGNHIEIDWIKLVQISSKSCFRKQVFLSANPRKVEFSIRAQPRFNLYINGKKVYALEGRYQNHPVRIDCTDSFRKGKNSIAIEKEQAGTSLILEGFIWCEDGSTMELLSDSTWRCSTKIENNWTDPDFDDKNWALAKTAKPYPGESRSYVGPIDIVHPAHPEPIFGPDEPITLQVHIPDKPNAKYRIDYKIINSLKKKDMDSGSFTRFKASDNGSRSTILKFKPKEAGTYDITFGLYEDNKMVDCRTFETAYVQKFPRREVAYNSPIEEGLDLLLVDSIDCGNPDDPHPLCEGKGRNTSKIVDTPLGSCREIAGRYSWFSYKIDTGKFNKPHLVVVEYPDDSMRTFTCLIFEGNRERTSAGSYTGDLYPITNRLQKLKFIYYKHQPGTTITILNLSRDTAVRIKSIKIYEIQNELPAGKILHPQDRMLGIFSENETCMLRTFYDTKGFQQRKNQPGYYRKWWPAIENHIKYLGFTGQNMFSISAWMYDHPHFPTNRFPCIDSGSRRRYYRDFISLMARMFDANDMSLILNVEFFGTKKLYDQYIYSDKAVRKGRRTIFQVNREGKQEGNWIGPVVNPCVPEVQEEILALTDEVLRLYGDCKGVDGISFVTGNSGWQPAFYHFDYNCPLNCSYDDISIEQFQKHTGITIPVKSTDPQRFSNRYQWLMKNAKQEWVQWRCDVLTKLNLTIYERVHRTGKKYYLSLEATGAEKLWAKGKSVQDIFREQGHDISKYKLPGFIVDCRYVENGNKTNRMRYYKNSDDYGATRAFNVSPEVRSFFDNGPDTGGRVENGFYEPRLTYALSHSGKPWYFPSLHGAGYCFPGHRYFLDSFVTNLINSTPAVITHTWTDSVQPLGYGGQMRRFGCAYQSIPEGNYRTLKGEGLDKNIVVRMADVGKHKYAYVLNPGWWEVDVKLYLSPRARCVDLMTDKTFKGVMNLKLKPYGLRPFKLTGRNAHFIKAECVPDSEAGAVLKTRLDGIQARFGQTDSSVHKSDERQLYSSVKTLAEQGDIYKALCILDAPKTRISLSPKWLVAGPFPSPERKGFDKVFPTETQALANKGFKEKFTLSSGEEIQWKRYETRALSGKPLELDFIQILGKHDYVVGYAYTNIACSELVKARFHIGSDDGIKVWLNGELVHSNFIARGAAFDQDKCDVLLQKGANHLLIKLEQRVGGWKFFFRIADRRGKDIPFAKASIGLSNAKDTANNKIANSNETDNNSLIAYWDFNEGSGSVLHDRTENGNDGTIHEAVWVKGIEGYGLKFDGEDDYVKVPSAKSDLNMGSGDFSMEGWFWKEGSKEKNSIYLSKLGYHMENKQYWGYNFNFGGGKFFILGDEDSGMGRGGSGRMWVHACIPEREWVFLAITIDRTGNSLRYYQNGMPSPQNPVDISAVDGSIDTPFDFYIGYFFYAGVKYYTQGIVDEVKIYRRVLSAGEIREHYIKRNDS